MSEPKPATIERARFKIDQLNDAVGHADLLYRYAVASGWLAALRVERLLDSETFAALQAELDMMFDVLDGSFDSDEL